jgi:signal transduction histidine kinase
VQRLLPGGSGASKGGRRIANPPQLNKLPHKFALVQFIMIEQPFTPAARRHIWRMLRALAPAAARVERRCRTLLRGRSYDDAQIRALLAILPSAASRHRSLNQFMEQVEYNGRRLAKLNVPPAEADVVLRELGAILDAELTGRFEPAREQLQLATILAMNQAYYQVREAETQTFFGLYRAEREAADLDDLLRRFVGILTQAFRARAGRLLLSGEPPTGKLARPLYIERGKAEEGLIADPNMRGRYASYWSYPVGSVALIQLAFPVAYPWLPRELALLVATAERCRDAIERSRMEREIQRLSAEARRTEEAERRRIGRELHDEAGQSMLALRLKLELMEQNAPAPLRSKLGEARAIVERTVDELRRIVAALSPAVLERLGLESAVRQLASRFGKLHLASVRTQVSVPSAGLPMETQEVIYRVAQECLQNIAKHSQATRVNLSLLAADKRIRLSVADNGAGFCAETALRKPMSFGLAGMRERAALLGGTLAVRSVPGKGTTVVLELPGTSARVANNVKDSCIPN